jgi:hypothetical protein
MATPQPNSAPEARSVLPEAPREDGAVSATALTVSHAPLVRLGTLQAHTPDDLVKGATEIANTLALLIRQKKLASQIQGREYVRVEGWTVLGALLGVIAREESVQEREDGSYLATVALVRMADNVVVSRASAECGMDEPRWAEGPKYARRSMALTRATGKASRLAFSWIMSMAGFEPTPLEEVKDLLKETPADPTVVPAGKHKGKKWVEVSDDYLGWAANADRCPPALKAACKAEIDRRLKKRTGGIDEDLPPSFTETEAGVRG